MVVLARCLGGIGSLRSSFRVLEDQGLLIGLD